jgi:selenocysteine-specific elongation factor
LPGLPPAGLVDVPGHEDLIRTMVAGATGIDLVLLVIDLAEGPRPQTEEHLAILEQLRVPAGIPVFTKADLVEADWAELVVADVMARLQRSRVGFEPPAIVSALTGQGIDDLRSRLAARIRTAAAGGVDDLFRMPIDRAFSVAGIGTVVTGTTWSGQAAVGEQLRILPGDQVGRLRSIESYGQERERSEPSTRTALGFVGVDRAVVSRGQVAVSAAVDWVPTSLLDVALDILPSAPAPIRSRTRVRVHLGTAEVLARVAPRAPIIPGGSGMARLVLEHPLLARGGDRLVLRSYSPLATIGGGWVADPTPEHRSSWPPAVGDEDPRTRLEALVARRRFGLPESEVPFVLGTPPGETAKIARRARVTRLGGRFLSPDLVAAIERSALAILTEYHRLHPDPVGLSSQTLRQSLHVPEALAAALVDDLRRRALLVERDGLAALPGFQASQVAEAAVQQLIGLLDQAGLEAPDTAELARTMALPHLSGLLKRAVEAGAIAAVERDRYVSTRALAEFRDVLKAGDASAEVTPAWLREKLGGLSRKFMIPLLEWSDRQGYTYRDTAGRRFRR